MREITFILLYVPVNTIFIYKQNDKQFKADD